MLLISDQEPITETSLGDYFRKRLTRYARKLRPPPHEDTCWYLGSLLDRFGRSEYLFTSQGNGEATLQPLALLYNDAVNASSEYERCLMLQHLGDMALFLGALFPKRLARYGIHQDYFVGMGGSAYDYLADNARQNRHIFAELANYFVRMLEMVADACTRRDNANACDILALYQRWLETGDELAGRQLEVLGIDLSGSGHRQ